MNPQDVSRDLFERRMRQRRAGTCVAAARASLAEGRTPEAIERLEEACRLDPEALEARLLLEEIRAEEPAEIPALFVDEPAPSTAGFGKWSHWVAAVIAVAALAALALLRQPGADEFRNEPARERAQPAVGAEAPAAADAADTVAPPVNPGDTVPLVIRPAETPSIVASVEPGEAAESSGAAVGTGGRPGTDRGRDMLLRPNERPSSQGGEPAPSTGAADTSLAALAPSRPNTGRGGAAPPGGELAVERPAVAGTGGDTRGETKAAATEFVPPPLAAPVPPAPQSQPPAQAALKVADPPLQPVPASNPAVPAVDDAAARRAIAPTTRTADPAPASYRAPRDEEEIGRTLQQYADAYERLDAAAARRVWPSVDERALARAFAGLQSQGISFDRCETEVEGAEARAVCQGRARYIPKVGSREPLTASRQWTFRLRRAGEGWQIASADVR